MKIKIFMSAILLMAIMFGLSATAVLAGDCVCDQDTCTPVLHDYNHNYGTPGPHGNK